MTSFGVNLIVITPFPSTPLTAEERPVESELLGQVLDLRDALVHGPGEVVAVVKAAEDDAGEVDRLREVAHQRALDAHHVPPADTAHNIETQCWKYTRAKGKTAPKEYHFAPDIMRRGAKNDPRILIILSRFICILCFVVLPVLGSKSPF